MVLPTVGPRPGETEQIYARRMDGKVAEVHVPGSCSLAVLRAEIAATFALPAEQLRLALGTAALDRSDASLPDLGIKPGDEVTVVVSSKINITRHIYNARGVAPPHRGTYLIATDEVELDPSAPLEEQWDALVPPDMCSYSPYMRTSHAVYLRAAGTPLPCEWEGREEPAVDPSKAAAEVFGGGDREVVVRISYGIRGGWD